MKTIDDIFTEVSRLDHTLMISIFQVSNIPSQNNSLKSLLVSDEESLSSEQHRVLKKLFFSRMLKTNTPGFPRTEALGLMEVENLSSRRSTNI
mmetsp:Transcript_21775/g.33639  ORF Transcript_21775/g.33639 Transcript_21775/m.33639 type:complete len:93 (-) Transcript_21775:25-303(-)